MQRRSLIEYLQNFYRHGADTAYAQRRGYRMARWSYREVAEAASQFACALEAKNIGRGDCVVLWGENSAEWVVAFWGCLLRGAVVVPMDHIASTDFVRRVSRQVGAKLLVCSRERAHLDPALPAITFENLPEVVAHHPHALYAPADLERDRIVQIIFTSGTTADPKGVVISHGNILANLEPLEREIQKYRKYERIFQPIRFLNLLPLSHVFGQYLGLFVPQLLGATVIFQNTLNPSEVVRTIKRERVSVLVAVPRVLETLRGKVERDIEAAGQSDRFREQFEVAEGEHFVKRWWRFRRIHNRFGWKFWTFISGGAALPPETEAFWRRLGLAVIQGYGLTETTSLVSVNHPFRLGKGSIGKVLPGQAIKLDPSGEILVRGENVASGYWGGQGAKPVPDAFPSENGWFHTGDIGEIDESGNLYFKGRKKNVIVTPAGMNVYPEDLEAALRREPEVRDCVVVGLEHEGNAEPCAVLILRDAGSVPELIVQRANHSLAEYQWMRRWLIWPEEDFPRTSTGKPRTNVIAEAVRAQMSTPGSASVEPRELVDLIARAVGGPTGGATPSRLSLDANLETDLNLSSLDRVELLSAIEDRYQIDLNETRFAEARTVRELEQLLRQTSARRSDYKYPRWPQRWPTTWIRLAVYYLLVWPATLLLGFPRVMGRANLRGMRGPVLVISNHVTSIDIGFILAALPARFRHRLAVATGGERLAAMQQPPADLGFLRRCLDRVNYALALALFNAFPLPKQSGFRESFAFAGESMDQGFSVLVFPEGQCTEDGKLLSFRAGIGLLANNLKVPIVPVRIDGLFELKRAGKKIARPGQIKVTIGAPIEFPAAADPQQIAKVLEARVAALGCEATPGPQRRNQQ
jgi:long-chain acyl-CoA synthetase